MTLETFLPLANSATAMVASMGTEISSLMRGSQGPRANGFVMCGFHVS